MASTGFRGVQAGLGEFFLWSGFTFQLEFEFVRGIRIGIYFLEAGWSCIKLRFLVSGL